MSEKRRFERFELPVEMKVTWPGRDAATGMTKDFGDGGAFVKVFFDPPPAPGTLMQLQLTMQVMGSEAPVLDARVVRVSSDGVAFELLQIPEQ